MCALHWLNPQNHSCHSIAIYESRLDPIETDSDILVTGHGMRSISGVELGLNINSVSQQQLEAIPGIGKKGAWRIISTRAKASRKSDLSFDTVEKAFIMSDLEMPLLAEKVLKI